LGSQLTPAQRAAASATLERLLRLFQQVPELATPAGFEILPVLSAGRRATGPEQRAMPDGLVEYGLALMFFVPTRAAAGEGCSCIQVRVNPAPPAPGDLRDERGHPIYIEEPRAARPEGAGILWQVPHATEVYGELWEPSRDIRAGRGERSSLEALFVAPGSLPWLPVTREVFYAASLRSIEGTDGQTLAEVRAGLAQTAYQQWMARAGERREVREQTIRDAATFQSAAEVAKLRRQLEETEREVTDRLRATDAEDRLRNQAALAASYGPRDSLAAELARMTPAERRMPAYVNNAATGGPSATGWTLTSDSTPPAWRVLTPNYDFWRTRGSAVAVRSLSVRIGISGTGLRPAVRQALLQAFRVLDWAAVRQLVDASR